MQATALLAQDHRLEKLARRVEAETAGRTISRRPTWAPTILLDGELAETCYALGLLKETDRPVVRLWACFAVPQHYEGFLVRGFELVVGMTRNGPETQLWQASKIPSGEWLCRKQVDAYRIWAVLRRREAGPIDYDDNLQEAAAGFCLQLRARELAAELVADYLEFLDLEQKSA